MTASTAPLVNLTAQCKTSMGMLSIHLGTKSTPNGQHYMGDQCATGQSLTTCMCLQSRQHGYQQHETACSSCQVYQSTVTELTRATAKHCLAGV